MHVRIEDIAKFEGQPVTLKGWLAGRRSSGKIHFLQVRDGSGFIQAVMSKSAVGEDVFKQADHLSQESAIVVHGQVRADSRAPGGFEIDATGLDVVSAAVDFPITPKEHGVDYLMDRRHLWIRSARQQAILRIRHEVIDAVRDYFNSRGFILADTPIFTPSACEGTTTLFPVQYFDDTTAYLTQSGQLYNEANAMALGKVYCFGPTFRAEKIEDAPASHRVLDGRTGDGLRGSGRCDRAGRRPGRGSRRPRARARGSASSRRSARHHQALGDQGAVSRAHLRRRGEAAAGKGPAVRVGRRPRRPRRDGAVGALRRSGVRDRLPRRHQGVLFQAAAGAPEVSLSCDILAPEGYGEIIGGGQRLDDYDTLLQRIDEHKLPREAFEWYLDLRRFGSVPHSGFGMGIERVVSWICGLDHLREAIPYPRMLYRLYP